MEFSGQYLTYDEYKALGGSLDQTPFNLLEYEARKIIDNRTLKRMQGINQIPQEVKMCMFQIQETINSKNAELTDIVLNYLTGVIVNGEHVVYLGVN